MKPASLNPYQRFEQAWVAYTRAPNEDKRRTEQDVIIALLKDQILGFTSSDAPRLRQLATIMESTPEFNKLVVAKVNALATQLELPFGRNLLLDDLWKLIITFISPAERNGINRSEKFFRALSQNASFLAQSINAGAHSISLAKLLPLLRICGSHVVELDLSRLLSEQDLAAQTKTEDITIIIEGIPLAQFVTLEGELRKKVLEKSAIIGDKIRKGLKFEDFLALPTEEQDHILNSNEPFAKGSTKSPYL